MKNAAVSQVNNSTITNPTQQVRDNVTAVIAVLAVDNIASS
ncbi:MAG TPA: hypothetical protein VI278_10125 [Nitrososphaeraceae archaeon]